MYVSEFKLWQKMNYEKFKKVFLTLEFILFDFKILTFCVLCDNYNMKKGPLQNKLK